MPKCLLLDLDGTLVDSVPDLAAALNRLMEAHGLAPFSVTETARMVGDGVERLVRRAFAARGQTPSAEDIAAYVADYGANYAVATRLYPDVEVTLRAMRADGWRLAVCTNKLERPARALLEAMKIGDLFAAIGGGDSFPVRKPDPAHLLATLERAGGAIQSSVMAGDHANDVKSAVGAGIPCIFAGWGYGTLDMAQGAVAVARSFADLPALASALLPAAEGRNAQSPSLR